MLIHIPVAEVTYLCALFLGLAVTCLQLVTSYRKKSPIIWLSLYYLAVLGGFFILFLFKTGLIVDVPHFYKVGSILALVFMPLSYLYIRSAIADKYPGKFDVLHFLPAAIFIIDYLPFFFSSGTYKRSFMDNLLYKSTAIFDFSQGAFFSSQFHIFLLCLTPIVYLIAQVIVLLNEWKDKDGIFRLADGSWIKWLFFYLTFQLMILCPMFIILISGNSHYLFQLSGVFGLVSTVFITISLFVHPTPLYQTNFGYNLRIREGLNSHSTGNKESILARTTHSANHDIHSAKPLKHLSKKQMIEMKHEIEVLLEKNEPFLKHGYSLQEMATSLDHPLYMVSALINQEYGTNFNELINRYRINYAVKMIKERRSDHLNIYGLADKCGFNNRNSFTSAFKKFTGVTPSEYFKLRN